MTKDRLNEFQMRVSRIENENKKVFGSGKTKTTSNVRKALERAEVLQQWIESVEINIDEIKQYLKRIEDIKYNKKDVRDKLDSLFQKNLTISHQITSKLREFQAELNQNNETAQARMQDIQFSTLKTRFQNAFQKNTTELENYKRLQKNVLKAQLKAKGDFKVTDEELTALIDEGKEVQVFTENGWDIEMLLIDLNIERQHRCLGNLEN